MKFILPLCLFLLMGCQGSMCGGDIGREYRYKLVIKLLDTTSLINEVQYENSNLVLRPLKRSSEIPVSFLEKFTIHIRTDKDSGIITFVPILTSQYEDNICESYREIKFDGLKFYGQDYPSSFMKRAIVDGYNYYYPLLYIDTLFLKK